MTRLIVRKRMPKKNLNREGRKDRISTSGKMLKICNSGRDVCVYMLVAQSCSILCNPKDCSLPGSSVHGVL